MTKRAKILWTTLVALVVVPSGAYVALTYWDWPLANMEADSALKAYRAAGLPWTADEVENGALPKEGNAAPQLRQLLNEERLIQSDSRDLYSDLTRKNIKAKTEVLALFGGIFDQVRSVLSTKQFISSIDWNDLHLRPGNAYFLARKLEDRAVIRCWEGKWEDAFQDFSVLQRLVDLAHKGNNFYDERMALQLQRWFFEGLRRGISVDCPLPIIQRALRSLPNQMPEIDWWQYMRTEAFVALDAARVDSYNQPSHEGERTEPPAPQDLPPREGWAKRYTDRAKMVRVLQMATKAKEIWDECHGESQQFINEWDKYLEDMWERRGASFVSASFLPLLGPRRTDRRVCEAELRVTRAYLAALLQIKRTGKIPKQISDLPGSWIDPFSGQDLRLVRMEDEIRIYSIGRDLSDDKGITLDEKRTGPNYDLAASIPIPRSENK